jgi:thioredoxin reductase (NADPH)
MEKLTIIGSGPAGLTAVLYAARARIVSLLIEGARNGGTAGGQLMSAGVVENFPTHPGGVTGPRVIELLREQISAYEFSVVSADAIKVNLQSRPFEIVCSNGRKIETLALIIATGSFVRRLSLESEKKFWENGISACAVCDGGLPLFWNKPLAVIGGGDSAAEEALFLTRFGSKIYLIHRRDNLRASRILQERLFGNSKIEILWNKTVVGFSGNDFLTGMTIKDEKTGETMQLEVAGAFEAIGHIPNTGFLDNQLDHDVDGHVRTRPGTTSTSIQGVFAAGDVSDTRYRQAITASASGCMAAMDAERWLQVQNFL